jgi:phospholipid transport system substrate-binding protein
MKRQGLSYLAVIGFVFLLVFGRAFAQGSPVEMIQSLANRLVTKLAQSKSVLRSSRADQFINSQVNAIIVPKVNLTYMAQSVIGRYYWNQATSAQRQTFIREFKQLVIANYSAALASYDDDQVKVYPLRSNVWQNQNVITVQSVIIRKNGQRIPINYFLSKTGSGWLINDFTIENVSMIESYRSQFANTLSQGGLSQLIQRLKSRKLVVLAKFYPFQLTKT